jgi:hypothetical protein
MAYGVEKHHYVIQKLSNGGIIVASDGEEMSQSDSRNRIMTDITNDVKGVSNQGPCS